MPQRRCTVTTTAAEDAVWGGRPSMGITLLFATFGFGADRFYVGQIGAGIALLIAYLTVFGAAVGVPVEWLSSLSLVIAILMGKNRAFMYGGCVVFAEPNMFDKVMAALWLLLMLFFLILFIVGLVWIRT